MFETLAKFMLVVTLIASGIINILRFFFNYNPPNGLVYSAVVTIGIALALLILKILNNQRKIMQALNIKEDDGGIF